MKFIKSKKTIKDYFTSSFFIALILSIFVIHLPLLYFISRDGFLANKQLLNEQVTKKEDVIMVDLNDMPSLPKRIADIDKPKVQKKPNVASAQSLYDSSVKEEIVSRSTKSEPKGSRVETHKTASPKTPLAKNNTQKKSPDKSDVKDKTPSPPVENLSMQDKLKFIQQKQKIDDDQKYTERFESTPQASAPVLRTNLGSPHGGTGGDFFPDYKVGDRTYLNTSANPNIGYFVELKKKFRFTFNPVPALRAQINQISAGSISVVWGISVDENGVVKGLTLLRGSGIDAYDQEARRTISSSAPFSKPPQQLIENKDRMLHMAWTFVVYL